MILPKAFTFHLQSSIKISMNLKSGCERVLFLNFVRWYKANKSRSFSQLRESLPAPDNLYDSSALIDAESVLTILNTLTEDKQEIVKLRFWGDLKFSEIAEKLNKNEAAVKKMFYRTLLELKEKLE